LKKILAVDAYSKAAREKSERSVVTSIFLRKTMTVALLRHCFSRYVPKRIAGGKRKGLENRLFFA
jgi:hypothetical protein